MGRQWWLSQNPHLHGICESSQRQVLKKIKGGGRGKDRQQGRMSLQKVLGCLVTRIGPPE